MSTRTISLLNYACGRSRSIPKYLNDSDSPSLTSKPLCSARSFKLMAGCAGMSRTGTVPTCEPLGRTACGPYRLLLLPITSSSKDWFTWPISSSPKPISSKTQMKKTKSARWCLTKSHTRLSRTHQVSRESYFGESRGNWDTMPIKQRSWKLCNHRNLRPSWSISRNQR